MQMQLHPLLLTQILLGRFGNPLRHGKGPQLQLIGEFATLELTLDQQVSALFDVFQQGLGLFVLIETGTVTEPVPSVISKLMIQALRLVSSLWWTENTLPLMTTPPMCNVQLADIHRFPWMGLPRNVDSSVGLRLGGALTVT